VVPLLLFAAAAIRLPLSTVGLLQFLTPILQLSCGVFIAHETVPGSEWIGFAIVWLALALLTYDSLTRIRREHAAGRQTPPSDNVGPQPQPSDGARGDDVAEREQRVLG
jgi:chloramphenicol-sensitive protein RarD